MFIGREKELEVLTELYDSHHFEFLVLFGRRRVGKTTLLKHFSQDKNAIFFSAQEKNDALNLFDFSKAVQMHFDQHYFGPFDSWHHAFEYIAARVKDDRQLIIIDEFPFIAAENNSIKSILQHTIDLLWKEKNIFLVLCGSSISFMENEVMGYKSPLYGRSTAQLELIPFDYYDSAKFFRNYSIEDRLVTYGILGGIPCYLESFDPQKSVLENLDKKILRTGAFLKEEPQVLLRMELREPAVYNSIFEAIANGASRLNEIAGKIHEDTQKCSKYLSTLQVLKLVEKIKPVGEDDRSKRTIYRICDNYIRFWYYYIFKDKSYWEFIGSQKAAGQIMDIESISNYMGIAFEKICTEYMVRRAKAGSLPIIPYKIGKWWGNDPKKRKQDDVDILLMTKDFHSAIFCECKYRNQLFDKSEFEDLISASEIFTNVNQKFYYIFSKSGFSPWVINESQNNENIHLIGLEELFSKGSVL